MSLKTRREESLRLLDRLEELYPAAHCALHYRNPWELLVATILSAQCTDLRVNLVTPELFRAYPDPWALAAAGAEDLEGLIRSTGFFHNKARNLKACARQLVERHGGRVPAELAKLTALPGVGRKTANVVLGTAFGIPGMVVDTHVKRLSRRFDWTRHSDPEKIEADLCRLLPQERWTLAGHLLIAHGRALCKAPRPLCSHCPLLPDCPRCGVEHAK